MKQNQNQLKKNYSQKSQPKPHDFLKIKAHCECSRCDKIVQPLNPQIQLDKQMQRLRLNNIVHKKTCDWLTFLNKLKSSKAPMPKFKVLDTIVMKQGEPNFAIYFEEGKLRIEQDISIKKWIIERKQLMDLQYQIKKYQRDNEGFNFSAFQHRSEKKIKQFQNNIRYNIPSILNRMTIIKIREKEEEAILSKSQFLDMFDLTKNKIIDNNQIQYFQVFPIMYGEEQFSYVKLIKYFRQKQSTKKSFKLAESYYSTWKQKNQSIEKLQENVYEQICKLEGLSAITQQLKLLYQTYKLLIYFQQIGSLRITEAALHYITNDNGKTFFLTKIQSMKTERRVPIQQIGVELPTKKQIDQDSYIHLRTEMKNVFNQFQTKFDRLQKQRQQMQEKIKKDKQYSNFVFNTLTQRKGDNFHKILSSKNQRFKKEQLNL